MPGFLSLNAAIFGSVLLASRLQTNFDVFTLMMFAVQSFGLFPLLRRTLGVNAASMQAKYLPPVMLNMVLMLASVAMLWPVSRLLTWVYVALCAFVNLACPAWLIWIQRYKHEIRGPWDEVIPQISQQQ